MNSNNSKNKINKVTIIISVVSLLFSIEAIIKCIVDYKFYSLNSNIESILILITTFLVIFYGIYCILFTNKESLLNHKFGILTETITLLLMFATVNIMSGENKSSYKALFLFAIVSVTIRKGFKPGIIVSLVSSCFIFIVDILFQKNYFTSINFQNDIIICSIFIFLASVLGYYINVAKKYINKLEDLANKDGLTEVYNHRYFYDKLKETIKISELNSKKTSLIFLDIDDFKYYNDLNGHQKGDYALKKLANILKNSVREKDIVCRYGGEEFAIILEDTDEGKAVSIGEKIRKAVESTEFKGEENQPKKKFTVSIGISEFPSKAKNRKELIKSADDALYRAKFLHKNRVETYVSILDNIKNIVDSHDKEVVGSIQTLISIINAKDRYTYGHVERVVIYAKLIANKLNLSPKDREILIYAAYIHDIGKINIPEEILIKKMPLTDDEWSKLKKHPVWGFDIIKDVNALKNVAPLVLYHHERYDGSGYPANLKGVSIPYLARVLTVIDSFDAMTSNRPYNTCKTYEEGKLELIKCSGYQFDPEIVQAFVEVIDENLLK